MKGAIAALALALFCAVVGSAPGCAKDPTDLIVAVSLDGTPARPITSLEVTIDAPDGSVSRPFASLGAVPADADVAPFTFPTYVDFLISNDAIAGTVTVTVRARDPLTDDTLLAHGMGMATVARGKTTAVGVALTLDAPPMTAPDGGVADGATDDGLSLNDGPAGDDGPDAAPAGP